MKDLSVVKPEEYFLQISPLRKNPDFNKLFAMDMEANIVQEKVVKKGGKGNSYQHTNTGYRNDLGINLRSNWEANFARILNKYKIEFQFEPIVFTFPIKKRNKSLHSRFLYGQRSILG
jgi:hypothetical protein